MGTMQLLAQQLEFSYPDTPVFTGVDLSVTTGDRLAIVGENGCGKSTLLSVLAGHLDPRQGTITRHGSVTWISQEFTAGDDTLGDLIDATLADINELAAHLEQEAEQFNHDTGNLTHLTELLNHLDYLAPWQAEQRITTALSRLNAPTDRDRKLAHMSVGQRYRTRLAVHLAARADFLLLDEPTNHLDLRYQMDVLHLMRSLADDHNITVGVVLHDLNHAAAVADTVIVMDNGQVVANAAPEESLTSALLTSVYDIDVHVDRHPTGALSITTPASLTLRQAHHQAATTAR